MLQAESLAGGSASMGLAFTLGFLRALVANREHFVNTSDTELLRAYETSLASIKNNLQECYQSPKEEDLEKTYKQICDNELLEKVVLNAVKLAGLEGKLYLENGRQSSFVLERKTGYNFKTQPFKFFLSPITQYWEQQNVRVFLVDGVIEKVSEIDQLLNGAFQTKQPGLIVARGFSEEVVATLKANFDRKTINIIPVRINSDLESINILNDIASVCGTDVLSSLKGEMVCFAKWEELPVIKKIRCYQNLLCIEEDKTKNKVGAQIKHLLNKRLDNQNLEDVVTLIDERIKSLTADSVTLRLPDITEMENQTIRAKVDTCLRSTKAILNNGLVNTSELLTKASSRKNTVLDRCIYAGLESLQAKFPGQVPMLSLFLALGVCGKQSLMIFSSKGAIVMEE